MEHNRKHRLYIQGMSYGFTLGLLTALVVVLICTL